MRFETRTGLGEPSSPLSHIIRATSRHDVRAPTFSASATTGT